MNANLNDILTIQILGWNSAADLPALLATLKPHEGEVNIQYIDNNSTDASVEIVRTTLPSANIIRLSENTGYGGGHNIGFMHCSTPFVLTVNPDITLNWDAIGSLVEVLQENPTWSGVQGLLVRPGDPAVIDSAGIKRTITLNGVDRGAGAPVQEFSSDQVEVDGLTGACAMYRMKALKSVAYGEYTIAGQQALEVFDKSFFAYKEDVDLGWRLQRAGWKNMFIPTTCATHARQIKPSRLKGLSWITDNRTALSLRNYIWMIAKNASVKQLLLHEAFIDVRLAIFFFISLIYWPLLPVWGQALRGLPDMLHKRAYEAHDNNS